MQVNVQLLSKKAIEAALKKNWDQAENLNEQILVKNPIDKDAKIRLGRAYIKLEKFSKAKKIFKEILDADPINSIAQKNYKLASDKNSDYKGSQDISNPTKILIKEPGTTTQISLPCSPKFLDQFEPGDEIKTKILKNKLVFFAKNSEREIYSLEDDNSKTVYNAKCGGKEVSASVAKTNGRFLIVTLKCKHPIFKSEKQQEKPYMKKGIIEEPELDLEEVEPTQDN